MKSQNTAIRKHLLSGKSLTPLQALKQFGCLRLAARISDLREGMDIITEMVKIKGKRVARYHCGS